MRCSASSAALPCHSTAILPLFLDCITVPLSLSVNNIRTLRSIPLDTDNHVNVKSSNAWVKPPLKSFTLGHLLSMSFFSNEGPGLYIANKDVLLLPVLFSLL